MATRLIKLELHTALKVNAKWITITLQACPGSVIITSLFYLSRIMVALAVDERGSNTKKRL
jgi:hypothetical protein